MSSMKMNRSKKKAVGVLAGLLAFGGLAAMALPANAEDNSGGPKIKLTSVDTDTVVASGRNFSANTTISVTASSSTLSGNGQVATGPDGRFLVAFRLPAGFNDKLNVVSNTPAATASINVSTPGTPAAPVAWTPPTTAAPAAWTPPPAPPTPPSATSPQLAQKLLTLPGAKNFNHKTDDFNDGIADYNSKITKLNAAIADASKSDRDNIQPDLAYLNSKIGLLNSQTSTIDHAILDINAKAFAAQTQAQIDALGPQLNDLTNQRSAEIGTIHDLTDCVNRMLDKLDN